MLQLSHGSTWVIGCVAASSFVVAGLLIMTLYGNHRESNYVQARSVLPEFVQVLLPDIWLCHSNTNVRGHEYTYSKNLRNGATGPASYACGPDSKPIKMSPFDKRAREGVGPRPSALKQSMVNPKLKADPRDKPSRHDITANKNKK